MIIGGFINGFIGGCAFYSSLYSGALRAFPSSVGPCHPGLSFWSVAIESRWGLPFAGSGYIARRPVRACGTPTPLLQLSHASASPPQWVTIPNANAGGAFPNKKMYLKDRFQEETNDAKNHTHRPRNTRKNS